MLFELISGLKVNFYKSLLEEAWGPNCKIGQLSFKYLCPSIGVAIPRD